MYTTGNKLKKSTLISQHSNIAPTSFPDLVPNKSKFRSCIPVPTKKREITAKKRATGKQKKQKTQQICYTFTRSKFAVKNDIIDGAVNFLSAILDNKQNQLMDGE